MDTALNLKRLARELQRRGEHRFLGNPFLGSLTAFLTLLFLVRIGANLYIFIDLSSKGSNTDALQIAGAHSVFLFAYMVWVGAPASLRISLALPPLCFVSFAPYGRRFRSEFVGRIAFLRPMNLASVLIILSTAIFVSISSGCWRSIAAGTLIVLASLTVAAFIVTAVARRCLQSRAEIQIMEILYLLLLVSLNPDIGSFAGRLSILFRGIYYFRFSIPEVGCAVALIVVVALFVLFFQKALSAMNNLFRRRISLSPMERWYWRFVRIRSWALLYLVVIPVFVSSGVSTATKRWTLVFSMLFGAASYLYFISHCENNLNEKWRCSLADRGNLRLIARSVVVHFILMTIPVLGYVFSK